MIHYKLFSFVILENFSYLCTDKLKQTQNGKNDQIIRAHGARPSVLPQALPRGSLAQAPPVDHHQSGTLSSPGAPPPLLHAGGGTADLYPVGRALEIRATYFLRTTYFSLC